MDSEEECSAAAVIIAPNYIQEKKKAKQRRHRSIWVKPWLTRRSELGATSSPRPYVSPEELQERHMAVGTRLNLAFMIRFSRKYKKL